MSELDILLKLSLACVFGGLIGYLREKEKKAAGLRTHILVCLGATLFTLVSLYMGEIFPSADAGRIAANVVLGIGFIGAGTIIRGEGGGITGITTAASIWITSAIGLALGVDFYLAASLGTLFTIIVLKFLGQIEKKYIRGE